MFKNGYAAILVVVVGGISGTGCAEFPKENNAKLVASDFFQARRDARLDDVLNMFNREEERPGYWRAHFEHIDDKLGVPVAYEIKHIVANTRFRSRIFTLDYAVHYPGQRISAETLTLYNDGEDMSLKVVSHQIVAQDFKSLY